MNFEQYPVEHMIIELLNSVKWAIEEYIYFEWYLGDVPEDELDSLRGAIADTFATDGVEFSPALHVNGRKVDAVLG